MTDAREAIVNENKQLRPLMDADKEWLVNENIGLRGALRRWRAIAIVAIVMVFAILIPFTLFFFEAARYYRQNVEMKDNTRELIEFLKKSKSDGK